MNKKPYQTPQTEAQAFLASQGLLAISNATGGDTGYGGGGNPGGGRTREKNPWGDGASQGHGLWEQ